MGASLYWPESHVASGSHEGETLTLNLNNGTVTFTSDTGLYVTRTVTPPVPTIPAEFYSEPDAPLIEDFYYSDVDLGEVGFQYLAYPDRLEVYIYLFGGSGSSTEGEAEGVFVNYGPGWLSQLYYWQIMWNPNA